MSQVPWWSPQAESKRDLDLPPSSFSLRVVFKVILLRNTELPLRDGGLRDSGKKEPPAISSKGESFPAPPSLLSNFLLREAGKKVAFFFTLLLLHSLHPSEPSGSLRPHYSSFPRLPFSHSPPPLRFSPFRNKRPALMNYWGFSFLAESCITALFASAEQLHRTLWAISSRNRGRLGHAEREKPDSSAPPLESGPSWPSSVFRNRPLHFSDWPFC